MLVAYSRHFLRFRYCSSTFVLPECCTLSMGFWRDEFLRESSAHRVCPMSFDSSCCCNSNSVHLNVSSAIRGRIPGALSSDHSAAFRGANEAGKANCPHGEAICTTMQIPSVVDVGGVKSSRDGNGNSHK